VDVQWLILVAIVLIAGSALQSAAGFGFGMFAIPLLVVLGAESYEAITIIAICGFAQTVTGLWVLRRELDWRQAGLLVLVAGAVLPLGVLALHRLTVLHPHQVRQVFGGVVLAALIVQWTWRVRHHERVHWAWGGVAMVASGFMAGLAGMGGPPAVLWVMAHNWSTRRSRVTLWALFTGLMPLQIFFLHDRFGADVLAAAVEGALLAPIALLGILPGLWIGHRMSKARLRQVSSVIILLVALYAILQPVAASLLERAG
jgi:uncharacterized membrane protein YfcA